MKLPKWLEDLLDRILKKKPAPTTPAPTTPAPTTWPPTTTTRRPGTTPPPDGPPPIPTTTGGPTTTRSPTTPTPTTSAPWPPVTTTPPPLVVAGVQALLDAHNKYRGDRGLRPLTLDSRLLAAAQKYADVMARTGHFDHTGPDGRSPFDRMKAEGYFYRSAGENIAYGQRNVQEVMQGWINSPGHEKNIRGNFANVGFGIAQDSRGRNYWVANFGTPSGANFIPADAEEFLGGLLIAEWVNDSDSVSFDPPAGPGPDDTIDLIPQSSVPNHPPQGVIAPPPAQPAPKEAQKGDGGCGGGGCASKRG